MTRYLVTGAAGFIGCNLVRALLDRGEQVVGIDDFSTGRRSNLDGVSGLELIEGDMTDLDTTLRAMDGVEYVLHQAAIPSVPRSVADPLPSHHTIRIASTQHGDFLLNTWGDYDITRGKQMINHQFPPALKLTGRDQRASIKDNGQHSLSPLDRVPSIRLEER